MVRSLPVVVAVLAVASSHAVAQPSESAAVDNQAIYDDLPPLPVPAVSPDTLAFGSAIELVGGSLNISSTGIADNSVDDELTLVSAAIETRYFRSLETTKLGYSVVSSASDNLRRTPFAGGSQFDNTLRLSISPEARFYPLAGSLLFVHGTAELDVTVNSVMFSGTDVDLESDSTAPGDVGVVVGIGFGRVLAIDPVVRLKRLETALAGEGLLAGPIGADVGTDIILSWYALRNDIGNYRQLAYAMKHLTDAGVLTRQPHLRATFEAMQVIDDPFIFNRRRGWEVRGGLGVVKPFVGFDDADEPDSELALVASAQYEQPMSTTQQLSLIGKVFFDPRGTGDISDPPRLWSLRGFLTYTSVFYTPRYVPRGSLTLAAEAGVTGQRLNEAFEPLDTGFDVAATAAYSQLLNRGSLVTWSGNLLARNDGVYQLTLSFGFSWGVASGYYTPYVAAGL